MKHLPAIKFKPIEHKRQRYNTCGDYFLKKGELEIRVSKLNADYELLILFHELLEWLLITKKGIKIKDIDHFDIMFERERAIGKWKDEEPGDDKRAPYFHEHQLATRLEKYTAKLLKVDWKKYNKEVNDLC